MPKRRTKEEWIELAEKKHAGRYDYLEVEYVNNSTKVRIRCREHGIFLQSPVSHSSGGQGCPHCSHENRRLDIETVIQQFRDVHGDKYDYSNVVYKNVDAKVKIGCSFHGEFLQSPYSHKNGQGCPNCADEYRPNRRLGLEKWIEKWRDRHGDAYDYSLVEDDLTRDSFVTIVCREHGDFQQRAGEHARYGCQRCYQPNRRIGTQGWIGLFEEVHAKRYDYSKFEYKGQNVPSTIICDKHGEFQQQPVVHLQGSGCSRCHYMRGATTEEWIQRCKEIHGDTYDYSKMDYVRHQDKVTITCKIHGDFEMLIGNHVHKTRPQGCPGCSESGFDPESPAVLYCMKYSGPMGNFWKIGISVNAEGRRNTLQSSIRSTKIYYDYVVEIEEVHPFEKGKDARKLESTLLEMDKLRYFPGEKFDGYQELFSVNPLHAR